MSGELQALAKQRGFVAAVESDVVRAENVPCVLKDRSIGTCTIHKSRDPESGRPTDSIAGHEHAVLIKVDQPQDGLVYQADGTAIGNCLRTDGSSWCEISIKKGSAERPENDNSAEALVYRYVRHIVGAAAQLSCSAPEFLRVKTPFKIPNTFEARSAIGTIQDLIRAMSIAIVGVGGTGSHILDLISKTPVTEIHILDSDCVDWHNLMRAPGAPTSDEIEFQRSQTHKKVNYFHAKYASLRDGITPHLLGAQDSSGLADFLHDRGIDFAFVCIDQLLDADSSRQDEVYQALSDAGLPFVDSGISLSLNDDGISGVISTTYIAPGSDDWQVAIPAAKLRGGLPGYRNVQLPEVNAMAASLAVMEWRRRTGQYSTASENLLHKFRIDDASVIPRVSVDRE